MVKKKQTAWDFDCAIIGGGPGGLISALYLQRYGRKAILFNCGLPRASWGPKVNNLIGYNNGISGRTLLKRIEKQIAQVGGLVRVNGEANVHKIKNGFMVNLKDGSEYFVRKVILASGIEDKHPSLKNLTVLRRRGILKYCSICDGFENSNLPIAVLAADNPGIEKALFIANWTRNLTLVLPRDFRIASFYSQQIKKLRLRVIRSNELRIDPGKTNGAKISLDSKKTILVNAIYVELGCRVRDEAFRNIRNLRRSKDGFIITTVEQRTSIKGLFAVGDCVNLLGQISVAAGQAAVAATTIHNDLFH